MRDIIISSADIFARFFLKSAMEYYYKDHYLITVTNNRTDLRLQCYYNKNKSTYEAIIFHTDELYDMAIHATMNNEYDIIPGDNLKFMFKDDHNIILEKIHVEQICQSLSELKIKYHYDITALREVMPKKHKLIRYVHYGCPGAYLDITDDIIAKYYTSESLFINKGTNLNDIFGDPCPGLHKQLTICYNNGAIITTETYPEIIRHDIHLM